MEEVKNILSNKMTLIMIMVIFIFSVQIFNLFKSGDETKKVEYIKKEISALKDDVKGIYKSYDAMGHKIDTFNTRIKQIHQVVNINNTKIENLKKYEKDKQNSFKSYDARMWEQFFADRYGKKNLSSTNTRK